MSEEKYITDGGYGASTSEMKQGYSNQNTDDKEPSEIWMMEYQEQKQYRNIGFGRDTGNSR